MMNINKPTDQQATWGSLFLAQVANGDRIIAYVDSWGFDEEKGTG